MPSPLQKSPYGVLGALDLKVNGQNALRYADELQGGLELLDFYTLDLRRVRVEGVALQNSGDQLIVTVPQGETWRVHAFSGALVFGAADTSPDGVALSIDWSVNDSFIAAAPQVALGYTMDPKTTWTAAGDVIVVKEPGVFLAPSGSSFIVTNHRTLGQPTQAYIAIGRDVIL